MTDTAILLVDDEPHVLSALSRALLDEPYDVFCVGSGEEGIAAMAEREFKVVISDERMPGMDGAEFLALVRQYHPATVRIMLTGHASVEATMRAVNSGEIYRFFTKPWDDTMLKLSIRSAIEKYDLEEENRRLLKAVRRQSRELLALEKSYPGISTLALTEQGAYELPEISEQELKRVIDLCNSGE